MIVTTKPTAVEILDALIEIESVGATVKLVDGRPKIFGNANDVPDGPKKVLKARLAELVEYLEVCERPQPQETLFVSKRLNYVSMPSIAMRGVSVFWFGDAPYFRVDPTVAMWVTESVNALKKKTRESGGDMATIRRCESVVADMWEWVLSCYPEHQIRSAQQRAGSLPREPVRPPECPGADAWEVRQPTV